MKIRPIYGVVVLLWILLTMVVLWWPRESIRNTGVEIRNATATLTPKARDARNALYNDDLWHVVLFMVLAVLVCLYEPADMRRKLIVLAAVMGFSLFSELVQEVAVPGRSFQWRDIALNQIGILTGFIPAVTALAVVRWSRRRPDKSCIYRR